MSRSIRIISSVAMLAIALGACGSDKKIPTAGPWWKGVQTVDLRGKAEGGQYPEIKISVTDNTFTPQIVRIDPGVNVGWKNDGRSVHNILKAVDTQDFGKQFGTDSLAAGAEFEFKFEKPGVYRYYCSLHGNPSQGMVGIILVGDVDIDSGKSPTAVQTVAGTLKVPQQYPTIQKAVDAAAPGSMVLIDKGTYHESVQVNAGHENIVIRGTSRNDVILDGQFDAKKPNGFLVQANGVAIENMTAMNYTTNAFYWRGVKGYRGSYLTSYRTGDYGLYAFDSEIGQFDHIYAAGSKDAGFYIGQCRRCRAVITDSISEWNGLGYSGTNAGGELYLVNSTWRFNRAGIVPNSETGEKLFPQRDTTIVGNRVYSNNNTKTPAIDIATTAFGNGILLAGGNDNVVERNLVWDHDAYGIAGIPLPEKVLDPKNPKAIDFDATGNTIRNNVIRDSRAADLALLVALDKVNDGGKNCFSGNTFTKSLPTDIETVLPCGAAPGAFKADLQKFLELFTGDTPPEIDYKKAPLPKLDRYDDMPNALTAPPQPANVGVPMKLDLSKITTPSK